MVAIHLRDISKDLTEAWEIAFAHAPSVQVTCGNILDERADAIVSPANSFGYMDGGIDAAYLRYFGFEIETTLRALLVEQHYGELPVGQALVLPTAHPDIPFLVSAPTMRVPGDISDTVNVYLAFRATLIAVLEHNRRERKPIRTVLVPGMGTGIGQVPVTRAARQMRAAYDMVVGGNSGDRAARQILREHHELLD
jgi:O-acetyl-ADP-ribose deacetylase (regulator of RNase III)